jgi:hypothetical protein
MTCATYFSPILVQRRNEHSCGGLHKAREWAYLDDLKTTSSVSPFIRNLRYVDHSTSILATGKGNGASSCQFPSTWGII